MSTTYQSKELGRIARFEYGKSQTAVRSLDGTIPVYGTGGLMEYASAFLHAGPSVIVGRKGSLGNPLYSDGPFWAVDTTYYAAECSGNMRWLHYVLCSLRLENYNEATGVPSLARPTLNGIRVPCPSPNEQDGIVQILSTIDRAIEQTEALLAKQQRIKTGLMHDLLTRGLDAQGRLRDPSTHRFKNTVLGSVPMEWDETDIGALAILVTSGPRGWARYYSSAGAKFIRIGNLTREHVNCRFQDMRFVSPPDGAEGNRTQLISGDVLFSITADLGVVGLIPPDFGPAYINQHIALIRPKTGEVVSGWLANFLASHRIQKWISNINESGAKAGLNLPTIKGLPVTVPKPPEQQMIADILALCDRQIAEIHARVLKLRRQKAGLMHDLLTGRVPVTPLLANPKAPI